MHNWLALVLYVIGFAGTASEPLTYPDAEIRSRGDITLLIIVSLAWFLFVPIVVGVRAGGWWKRRRG